MDHLSLCHWHVPLEPLGLFVAFQVSDKYNTFANVWLVPWSHHLPVLLYRAAWVLESSSTCTRAAVSSVQTSRCVSVPSHKASFHGREFHQKTSNFIWQKPYLVPSLSWQMVALPVDFSGDGDLQNTNPGVVMMIQTQSPDTWRAEYAGELEINKFLLKEWCGMEVMGYRISLDC